LSCASFEAQVSALRLRPGNLFNAANKVCLRGGLNLEEF
jgi:hypothetical protein